MRAIGLLGFLSLGVLALACSMQGTPCSPGDYAPCACSGGARGAAICASDGSGYGACDCSGQPLPGLLTDASTDGANVPDALADAALADAGGKAFGEACSHDEDCAAPYKCLSYQAKGNRCSLTCSGPADCPVPPGLGCGGQGQCKVP